MNLAVYIGLLERAQRDLAEAFDEVGSAHQAEFDVAIQCHRLATQCREHASRLKPFAEDYGEASDDEPDRLQSDLFSGVRQGSLALLRDLQDLYLMACECDVCWTLIGQAAQGIRDEELITTVEECEGETSVQISWLRTRMKEAAPQALVVPA